jgi:hypothetical protein
MKTRRIKFILGLMLLWPMVGWSHALSPTYYPLGHLPIYLGAAWRPFFVLIPLAVAVEALMLWVCARSAGKLGNLWRAGVLYLVARAAETGTFFLLQSFPLFRRAGWTSSAAENFGPLLLFLGTGLMVAVPAGLLLYRRTNARPSVIVTAVCTSSFAGCVSAFGYSLLLIMTRGY